MDPHIEEKLDNFEGVISSFEQKKVRGEEISAEQITILQSAFFSILAHHTIAQWWRDEVTQRIADLKAVQSRFPQPEADTGNSQSTWQTSGCFGHTWSQFQHGIVIDNRGNRVRLRRTVPTR